jgi:hypothetical protein
MKTAISIPDDTYASATQRARDLGWSRSEFFTRAARHYLGVLDRDSVETQINASLELLDQPDESGADAVALAHRLLSADEW